MIKENLFFLTEFLREFKTTGACLPTSRWAAQALIAPLTEPNRSPKRILELGPGTGSVTVPIVLQLREGDQLTICEINPRFMKALKEKLNAIPAFQKVRDQVEFFEGPAQQLPENGTYDMIVCALPFLNFELSLVQEIFAKLRKVSTPETLMTYYEFIGLRKVGESVSHPDRRKRLSQISTYMDAKLDQKLNRERVWLNVLPINVYTIRPAA